MERFVIIINGWRSLIIITKRSISDVAAVLDPPLMRGKLDQDIIWENNDAELLGITLDNNLRGCSYDGELPRLGGLPRLVEMIFVPRSYGIFYLTLVKKFVMSLIKDCLIN